ncbi:copper amine oxidase N-terminal domain-containing protein [Paenibacillus sp. GSMTC-2017]|nr:copper amine oxidase N-terminal domain-containing protein [Paenibacillus sp. GSMTC-2017]
MNGFKSVKGIALAIAIVAVVTTSLPQNIKAQSKPVTITLNDVKQDHFKNPPLLQNGSVFLPLRETGNLLKSKVSWISEGKRIIVNGPKTTIELKLGTKTAIVNGKSYTLTAIPMNKNGVVYVPIRFISEAFGSKAVWKAKEKTVNR